MPFVCQRVRCIELVTYFFYQILALEGVRRFAWYSHNIRHIPDPQRTRVQNSRKYIANSVRFDRQTWRFCLTTIVPALRMLQPCCGDPIFSVALQSLERFDKSPNNQSIKYGL